MKGEPRLLRLVREAHRGGARHELVELREEVLVRFRARARARVRARNRVRVRVS